ncbi:unnamed protein product (mitochondrion) [Plasmodiophora brassicae]|uniref:Uncharacterized protein n=1 Tax=Plasmodiophora brassicae TaxID=37360 RepID=A0A3P3YHJ2_PLABS|nr:unnamed protein product [Plasmodiophora brassicae]
MTTSAAAAAAANNAACVVIDKKPVSWQNVAIGAALQTWEVSTLGQPFEVIKTHMAANRGDGLKAAVSKIYERGGVGGFWQGLVPWAWIEASTKGAVLLLVASEVDYQAQRRFSASPGMAGLLGGMAGGLAQAYTTMGFCTFMKTVEVTRHKTRTGQTTSTWAVAADIYRQQGIAGMYKGVSAVALRQMTNWGSRLGIARVSERIITGRSGNEASTATPTQKVAASVIGGALACWNHPIEVIRVEMQSMAGHPHRPRRLTITSTAQYIYANNGIAGFFRGVTPRIALSVYLTVVMVFGGDQIKAWDQSVRRG